MNDIRMPKPKETREIESLVDNGPYVWVAPEPPQHRRKSRVDRYDCYRVAILTKLTGQSVRQNSLPAQDLQTRRYQRDPRQPEVGRHC